MLRRHAVRLADAFGRVFRQPGHVVRRPGNVYRLRIEIEGVRLDFDDADDAVEFLVRRWWR